MSKTGQELKNSVNLKFNWNKVSRQRNTARRPTSKMLKLEKPGKISGAKEAEIPGAPECEKPQSSASESQYSVGMEYVPIKKRRFFLQTPSPPSQALPHSNEFEELDDGQSLSGTVALADAACNDGLENSAGDLGRNASVGVLVQEKAGLDSVADRCGTTLSSQLCDSSGDVNDEFALMASRDNTAESVKILNPFANMHPDDYNSVTLLSNDSGESNISSVTVEETKVSSTGSRVDRLHWDLNVPMDEWEEPLKDATDASGLNFEESRMADCTRTPHLESSDMNGDLGEVKKENESTVLPSLSHISSCTALVSDSKEHILDASPRSGMSFLKDDSVSSSASCHASETSIHLLDSKDHAQGEVGIADMNHKLHIQSDDVKTQSSADSPMKKGTRSCHEAIDRDSISSVDAVQVKKFTLEVKSELCELTCKLDEPCQLVLEKCETAVMHGSEAGEACDEPHIVVHQDGIDHGIRNNGELKEINESSHFINPSKTSMLGAYAAAEALEIPANNSAHNVVESNCENERDFDSLVSHEDCGQGGSTKDLEGGYESHLEDGELREPVGHYLVENEDEDVEQVDYDTENEDAYDTTDATTDPFLSKGRVVGGVGGEEKGNLSPMYSYKVDQTTSRNSSSRNSHHSFPIGMKHELFEPGSGASRKATDESDCFNKDRSDVSGIARDSSARMIPFPSSMRERVSHIEGSVPYAKVAHSIRGSSFTSMHDDEMQRGSVGFSGDISSLHLDGRDQHGIRSRNYVVRGASIDSTTVDGERRMRSSYDTFRGVRKSTSYSNLKSGYSRQKRKGLTTERDDAYDMGKVNPRALSPENANGGRLDRYITINKKGYRKAYRRPGAYENIHSMDPNRNQFRRRDRSFSPLCNRADHVPRVQRRFGSGSRSRSPDLRSVAGRGRLRISYPNNHVGDYMDRRSPPSRMLSWGQRFDELCSQGSLRVRDSDMNSLGKYYEYDQDEDFKREPHFPRSYRRSRSRSGRHSPEFRYEARAGTMRVPYQLRGANQTRGRRSPMNMPRPAQRLDTRELPGRMISDDYVRPIMRHVRSSDASQSSRRNGYENDEFRRKPRKVFERIHPIRRYVKAGEDKRFHYDPEDDEAPQDFGSTDRKGGDVIRREARRSPELIVRDSGDDARPKATKP